jgi:3'-phosphoadenosine 5'-phosphosulfate sulfotransferase (PAPS reductase)/FAD synthetase
MSETLTEIEELPTDATDFALFSGGNDSVVSTHVAYKNYDIDYTVYLDTNTGLTENKEHVKGVCQEYGWDLLIAKSPYTLRDFVLGNENREPLGFPGPSAHSWAFQLFKERQLGYIATQTDNRPRYYAGVRQHESQRRMENVEGDTQEAYRWTWVRPIWNWRDERVDDYRAEHDLPHNPVDKKIGRSGDCYCGAYANRSTELVELEAHYPDHAEWLKEVEKEAQEQFGTDEDTSYWGFANMSEKDLRAVMADNDDNQMMLCSSCDVPNYPSPE